MLSMPTDSLAKKRKHVYLWLNQNMIVFPSGGTCNLPTIPSASDFNTVLSSDQNTLDESQHSQHSTSQEDMADIEEGNQCPAAVQLADAQVWVHTFTLLFMFSSPAISLHIAHVLCLACTVGVLVPADKGLGSIFCVFD